MFLTIFAFHENVAIGALYQRVMTGFNRVNVQLCSGSLGRYDRALAQAVSHLTLILASSLVEVSVILQSLLLHFWGLVNK